MAPMGLYLLQEGAPCLQTKVPATEQVGFIHSEGPLFLIQEKAPYRLVVDLIFPHQLLSSLFRNPWEAISFFSPKAPCCLIHLPTSLWSFSRKSRDLETDSASKGRRWKETKHGVKERKAWTLKWNTLYIILTERNVILKSNFCLTWRPFFSLPLGREEGRERKKHWLVASPTHLDWGSNPQPGYNPWLGIEPTTLQSVRWHSNQLNHTSQGKKSNF